MTQLAERASAVAGGELLTRAEVCAWLKISPRTLDRIVARGELEPLRAGFQPRFRPAAVEAHLSRQQEDAVQASASPLYLELVEWARSSGWFWTDKVVALYIEQVDVTSAERASVLAIIDEIRIREWGSTVAT